MHVIFAETRNVFTVVKTAREEPRRFGKNGELLINYVDTKEHFRRASVISEKAGTRGVERASVASRGGSVA